MRFINRCFSVSEVCTLILFIVPTECGLCQQPHDRLAITIRDNALSTDDFAQKLDVATTGEAKALLASFYFANQTTTKLDEIVIDKSTPAAVRWLAAWEKLKRHAQCQMLRDKSTKTRFQSDDLSEFFRDIERESKIPKRLA